MKEQQPNPTVEIVGGILGGVALGITIVFSNPFVSGIAQAIVPAGPPMRPQQEFGPRTDRAGSATYLLVQVAFLALAVAMLVIGIWRARRSRFQAAVLIVSAVVMAVPFTPCTIDAVTNAAASFKP